ncbi:MAG: hypothetical protein LBU32_33200, partial [Clostridiales bacterium]|nr:hypothetical protein [Clostridiales bacterium]
YENTFYGHLSMPQTHKWLNIFILSGEAKLHRGLYEKQYSWMHIEFIARLQQFQRICKYTDLHGNSYFGA